MRWASLIALSASLCCGSGCAWFSSAKPHSQASADKGHATPTVQTNAPKKGLIVTPAAGSVGKVVALNPQARYIVVSFPIGQVPPIGHRMNLYRDGLKTGEAKVTGPQKENITIADIQVGDPQIGDEMRAD